MGERDILALSQPIAWAVTSGALDVLNRLSWHTRRGPTWIAARIPDPETFDRFRAELAALGIVTPDARDLPTGCVVGRVTITDGITPGGGKAADDDEGRDALGKFARSEAVREQHERHPKQGHTVGLYGYLLDERRALTTPVPCDIPGRRFEADGTLLGELQRELSSVVGRVR